MFPCAHEPPPGDNIRLDLREVDLNHHALLASVPVANLGDAVARSPNFEEDLLVNTLLRGSNHELCLLEVASSATRKVGLVLLALGVSKVGAFVGMKCETETTFEGA